MEMDIKYGIIAYKLTDDPNVINIVHFCGYEKPLTNDMFLSLTDELNTSDDFDLKGQIGVNVFLMESPPDYLEHMREVYEESEHGTDNGWNVENHEGMEEGFDER